MSQRTALTAPAEKATADQAAQRVQPGQRGEQPALAQNLLHLQQAVGNRATQGLLSTGLLQAKLRIGPAGDSFEREADHMAHTVMRMTEPGTRANATQVAQVRPDNVQRVCSECEEELRHQPLEEEELLQAKPSTNASAPVNTGVESRIASLRGGGRPLSPALRSFFEPRFNHDFSDVRVHTGGTAAASARTIKARAFTVGREIAFGAGQYAPESRSGRHLLAHELTHTIQQTQLVARRKPLIQRQPEALTDLDSARGETEPESTIEGPVEQPEQTPAGPQSGPETPVPGETPAPGLIVGDETSELGPGQMGKSAFLAELRSGICAAADEPLSGTQYTAQGCPTIQLYLRIYEGFSAERIEQDLSRFMPEAAGITDAREYIPLMAARVRRSVEVWVQTGEITGVPEGLPTGLPGLGAIARILFKARSGGPRSNPNPQAVQTQLGTGRPMNSAVGSRMSSAFGNGFSNVRVHTDANATQLTSRFNARAFTVGNHVAFGTGEYRPGILMGDALIAHELAHTVQQGGKNTSVAPMQPGNTGTTALENDADKSAVGVVASLWGGTKGVFGNIAQNSIPRLASGLGLQRCATTLPAPVPVHLPQSPSRACTTEERQSGDPDKTCCTQPMIGEIQDLVGQGIPVVAEAITRLSRPHEVRQQIWDHFRIRPNDDQRLEIVRNQLQHMMALMNRPNDVVFLCSDWFENPLCGGGVRARSSNCQSSRPVYAQLCGQYTSSVSGKSRYLDGEHWLKTIIHEYAHLACPGGLMILGAGEESYQAGGPRPYPPGDPDLAVKNPDSYASFVLDR